MSSDAGDPVGGAQHSRSLAPHSLALADLRDQIVRLQQQWRESAGNRWARRLFGDEQYDMLERCADGLDPLLTLVRSLLEQEKKDK
jgi:hypothetical protein